jgi:hypothetical protein
LQKAPASPSGAQQKAPATDAGLGAVAREVHGSGSGLKCGVYLGGYVTWGVGGVLGFGDACEDFGD